MVMPAPGTTAPEESFTTPRMVPVFCCAVAVTATAIQQIVRKPKPSLHRMSSSSFSSIPLLAEEGWRDSLIEAGAPGAKREPDRAKPQLVVSSAKRCAGLTTPSAPLLRSAQPPRLCEEGNAKLFSLWNT